MPPRGDEPRPASSRDDRTLARQASIVKMLAEKQWPPDKRRVAKRSDDLRACRDDGIHEIGRDLPASCESVTGKVHLLWVEGSEILEGGQLLGHRGDHRHTGRSHRDGVVDAIDEFGPGALVSETFVRTTASGARSVREDALLDQ